MSKYLQRLGAEKIKFDLEVTIHYLKLTKSSSSLVKIRVKRGKDKSGESQSLQYSPLLKQLQFNQILSFSITMHKKNSKFVKKNLDFTALEIQGKSEKRIGSLTLDFHSVAETGKPIDFQEFALKESKESGKLCLSVKLFMQNDINKKPAVGRSDSLGNVRRAFSIDEAEGLKLRDELESLDDTYVQTNNLDEKVTQEKKIEQRKGSSRDLRRAFAETKNDIEKDLNEFREEEKNTAEDSLISVRAKQQGRVGGLWNLKGSQELEERAESHDFGVILENQTENYSKSLQIDFKDRLDEEDEVIEKVNEKLLTQGEHILVDKQSENMSSKSLDEEKNQNYNFHTETLDMQIYEIETIVLIPFNRPALDIKTINITKAEKFIIEPSKRPVNDIKTVYRVKTETHIFEALNRLVSDINTIHMGQKVTNILLPVIPPVLDIKIIERGKPEIFLFELFKLPNVDIKTLHRGIPTVFNFNPSLRITVDISIVHRGKVEIFEYMSVHKPGLSIEINHKNLQNIHSFIRPTLNIQIINDTSNQRLLDTNDDLKKSFKKNDVPFITHDGSMSNDKEDFKNFRKNSESSSKSVLSESSNINEIDSQKNISSKIKSSEVSDHSMISNPNLKLSDIRKEKLPMQTFDIHHSSTVDDLSNETKLNEQPGKEKNDSYLIISSIITDSTFNTQSLEELQVKPETSLIEYDLESLNGRGNHLKSGVNLDTSHIENETNDIGLRCSNLTPSKEEKVFATFSDSEERKDSKTKNSPDRNPSSNSENTEINAFDCEFLVSSSSESSEENSEVLDTEEVAGPLTDMKEALPNSASQEARLNLKEKESGLPESRNTTCCGKCSIF